MISPRRLFRTKQFNFNNITNIYLNISMTTYYQKTHRCKVDFNNNSEVLYHLQHKSQDLYAVWHNYNELYSKYEQALLQIQSLKGQIKPAPKFDFQELESLRRKVSEYERIIQSLKNELQRSKQQKKNSFQFQVNNLSSGYEKQIRRLKEATSEFQNIIRLKDEEIKKQRSEQERYKKTLKEEQLRYREQIEQLNNQNTELKRQLREINIKSTIVPRNDEELENQIKQNRKKEEIIRRLKIAITDMEYKYEQNLKEQIEKLKRDFQNEINQQISYYRQQSKSIIVQQSYELS